MNESAAAATGRGCVCVCDRNEETTYGLQTRRHQIPAWGSLEPPRRDGENAQKTEKNGGKRGLSIAQHTSSSTEGAYIQSTRADRHPPPAPDLHRPHGGKANYILARGETHLPFAQPAFGTPCAATAHAAAKEQRAPASAKL